MVVGRTHLRTRGALVMPIRMIGILLLRLQPRRGLSLQCNDLVDTIKLNEIPVVMDKWLRFVGPINEKTTQAIFQVVDNFFALGANHLHILMSSGGGSVFHGLALNSYLRNLPIECTTYGFNSVQSVAVPFFCVGQQRICTPETTFMIHSVYNPQLSEQNVTPRRLREMIQTLQEQSHAIATVISRASGQSTDKVKEDMEGLTHFNAEQAKEYGLVHQIRDNIVPSDVGMTAIYEDGSVQYWKSPSAPAIPA